MLLSFRASNHRSLAAEQQVLLTPVYAAEGPDEEEWDAVPVAGIFGPNASGKSNVLDALLYMRRMVRDSLQDSEPGRGPIRHPYALDPAARREPSSFVVDLLLGRRRNDDELFSEPGVRHEYGFTLDDDQIVEEWLYSYPHKQRRKVFHRQGDVYDWGSHSFKELKSVADIVETNVLFLSVAARSRQGQAEIAQVYDWFTHRLSARRPMGTLSQQQLGALLGRSGDAYLSWLNGLLRAADTGIEDTELVEESEEEFELRRAMLSESSSRKARPERTVLFRHRGEHGTVPLGVFDESTGTQSLIALSNPVFTALRRGDTLIVDELDASLHPYLSAHLIGLFQSAKTNPLAAQLVFSTHDAALLGKIQGAEVLRRDQIWFTEKDECGRTELFPLTDFKPRKDENRELRYLAGRYGAVPTITDDLVLATLAERGPDLDDA
ncbi:hypothetical protein EDD29_7346 [Actinocorallia herbida]|uniref:ATPase AAA-type core domain-containing protein n=1 Tax=Actinocorallia herbida TaxID=58109 RepID=A0A3N1D819_9ACTN|nr:ATP-binding protein [Actinocorallia herbida]ROO89641.1 hypothetical protein EDD29_7346 [Actinocorallia herbida]